MTSESMPPTISEAKNNPSVVGTAAKSFDNVSPRNSKSMFMVGFV
jgi:hypothetical protein